MKLLSFTALLLISISSFAVEFHRCVDNNGQKHFTNLPKNSLDSNCSPKDHYALMLNNDYQNLSVEHGKYQVIEEDLVLFKESKSVARKDSKPFDLREVDLSIDTVKSKVKDILNPDKALEELMMSTEDRDDAFTRAMRGRAKGIQTILDQE